MAFTLNGMIRIGTAGGDLLTGEDANDRLLGNRGADTLYGLGGDDSLRGGKDADILYGSDPGAFHVTNDILLGDLGDDWLQGNKGDDTLYGGAGTDTLRGGKQDDFLHGNAGDDLLYGDRGANTITGGDGNDIFVADGATTITSTHTITDFTSIDQLRVEGTEMVTVSQDGADTRISFATGNFVLLSGIDSSRLQTAVSGDGGLTITVDPEPKVPMPIRLFDWDGTVTFLENAVNTAAQRLDPDLIVVGDTHYLNGQLAVRYGTGGGADDQLSVRNQGNGAGQIGFDGTNVTYGGIVIATVSGVNNGVNGADLVFTLTGGASNENIIALLEHLTYANASDTPAGSRTLTVDLVNGSGGSVSTTLDVQITIEAEPATVSNFDLATLNGSNGTALQGIDPYDYAYTVANAGDVNGDGFDDFLIGARRADPDGKYNAGETYLVFGQAGGWGATIDLASLDGKSGVLFKGIDTSDYSGGFQGAIGTAGDVNGDGFDDLLIGAYGGDPNGINGGGEAYLIFGGPGGWDASFDLTSLDGTNGVLLKGFDTYDYSGWSVSEAGDINGDGFGDFLIGAICAGPNGNAYAGETYLVFGKAGGWSASFDLATLDGADGTALQGIDPGDEAGLSVSGAGDVNGDGFDDVVIGAWYADPGGDDRAGEAYLIFGRSAGWGPTLDLAGLDGTGGVILEGIDTADHAGISVSGAGDVNGDGFADLLIGAPGGDPNGDSRAGEAYLIFGKTGGWGPTLDLAGLDGSNGLTLEGIDTYDGVGNSISTAGDVNGDGIDDILIGAWRADPDGKYNAGETYLIFGKTGGWGATLDLGTLDGTSGFTLEGVDPDDITGRSVSSTGDVNGDGLGDLLISGLADPGGDFGAGESYLVFGSVTAPASNAILGDSGNNRLDGGSSGDALIGAAGDDTLDGGAGTDVLKGAIGSDVLIGGPGADKLWGGFGSDVFVFSHASDAGTGSGNRDVIHDFRSGTDTLDFSGFAGTFSYRGTAAFSGVGTPELRHTTTGNNSLLAADLDGDGAADLEVQLLGTHGLTAGDFIL